MKQIFLFLLLLIAFSLSAQRQLPFYNAAAGTLTQTAAGSGYVDVRINYSDQTGMTTGSTLDNTCVLLYFNTDESIGYELPITSVVTASSTNPVVRVNITGFPALNGAINGQGVIYKKTSSTHFAPFVSNASNSLQQVIQEAVQRDLNSALIAGVDVTKYVGSGVPAFTPTTNEPKLAQGLSSPYPFYAYNGTAWVLVGGSGLTANSVDSTHIKQGSIAASDLSQHAIDSVLTIFKGRKRYFGSSGQSNSIGQGVPAPSKTYIFADNFKVHNGVTWVTPQLGQLPFNLTGANNASLQFVNRLALESPRDSFFLMQGGNSGQPISYWITVPQTGFAFDTVTFSVIPQGEVLEAFIWTQSESDYTRTSEQYYTDYYTLRTMWKTKRWYSNTTKHINVGIYTGVGNIYGFQDHTLKKIGSDSIVQTSYANPYGLVTYDNVHWTDSSLTVLGREVIYNAFLATPYAYKLESGVTVNSTNILQKSTGTTIADSRISDDGNNTIITDNVKETKMIIRSNVDSTVSGQTSASLYFDGRWATSVPLASSDSYGDASISLERNAVLNSGGTALLFKTSDNGAGGLNYKARITKEGYVDAKAGFTINSLAVNNNFLIGDGNKFTSRALTGVDVSTAFTTGLTTNQIQFAKTSSTIGGSSRFSVEDGNLAGIEIKGGDGSSGTNGAYLRIWKDNAINFAFGSESAFYGGTGTGGLIYQYGANPFTIATNGVQRLYVGGTGNVGIGTLLPTNQLTIQSNADPLKLIGLQQGVSNDSLITSNAGVIKRYGLASNITAGDNNTQVVNASISAGSNLSGGSTPFTITVSGAQVGDFVDFSVVTDDNDLTDVNIKAWVSATNTVSYQIENKRGTTINFTNKPIKCRVRR